MSAGKSKMTAVTRKQRSPCNEQLWRRINNNPKFEQATTVSNHGKKEPTPPKTQTNINHFLQKLQHKMTDSIVCSESEIVERESIDWSVDLGNQVKSRLVTKTVSNGEDLIYSSRRLRDSHQYAVLAQIKTIEEFLCFIEGTNSILHHQISEMLNSNINLELECETLRFRHRREEEKNQVLNQQIQILQRSNHKLKDDLNALSKEVQLQIELEQEKIRVRYDKMMQAYKQELEKKLLQNKLSDSTKFSSSIKSSTIPSQSLKTSIKQDDHAQIFINENGEYKRGGKLRRSNNKRTSNFSSGARMTPKGEDLEQARFISGGFNKVNNNYDKIIHHVLQQDRKQIRSLKLPTNS